MVKLDLRFGAGFLEEVMPERKTVGFTVWLASAGRGVPVPAWSGRVAGAGGGEGPVHLTEASHASKGRGPHPWAFREPRKESEQERKHQNCLPEDSFWLPCGGAREGHSGQPGR